MVFRDLPNHRVYSDLGNCRADQRRSGAIAGDQRRYGHFDRGWAESRVGRVFINQLHPPRYSSHSPIGRFPAGDHHCRNRHRHGDTVRLRAGLWAAIFDTCDQNHLHGHYRISPWTAADRADLRSRVYVRVDVELFTAARHRNRLDNWDRVLAGLALRCLHRRGDPTRFGGTSAGPVGGSGGLAPSRQ